MSSEPVGGSNVHGNTHDSESTRRSSSGDMAYSFLPDDFPPLCAGRWRLRELRPADAVAWLEYASDPVAVEGTSGDVVTDLAVMAAGIAALALSFRAKSEIRWAIADAATDEMVGTIGLNHFDERNRRAEIGYQIVRRHWGQGIATAAGAALVAFGFETLSLNRIEATVLVGNDASMRVLEKLGFEREGLLRAYKLARGQPRDFVIFSRIA